MESGDNIKLTIGNIIFYLNKKEYQMLKSYLDQASRYFHSLPNGQKNLSEFESDLSEFFLSELKEGNQLISQKKIQDAITHFGIFNVENGNDIEKKSIRDDVVKFDFTLPKEDYYSKIFLTVLSIIGLSF